MTCPGGGNGAGDALTFINSVMSSVGTAQISFPQPLGLTATKVHLARPTKPTEFVNERGHTHSLGKQKH